MRRSSFLSTKLRIERSATARSNLKVDALGVDELEAGLALLDHGAPQDAFWDSNVAAFRQTVLEAIGETSDALLSKDLTTARRDDLEEQVRALRHCIEVADSYVVRRSRISGPHGGGQQSLKIN
jgi:hypothetical protein